MKKTHSGPNQSSRLNSVSKLTLDATEHSPRIMSLDGLVTIVTGGGRGIGRAVACSLASEGARVVACSRTKEELERTAETIKDLGGTCETICADVSNPSQVADLVKQVQEKHSRIDVLVHCAGYTAPYGPLEEVSLEDYENTMDTNAGSLFYFARSLVPIMRSQERGMIVAMSSGAGLRGHARLGVYSMSKFAVQGLIQALAGELENSPVSCIAINPGGVATKMLEDLFGKEEAQKNQPPEAVANVVKQVVSGELPVPSGGGVVVRRDEVRVYER